MLVLALGRPPPSSANAPGVPTSSNNGRRINVNVLLIRIIEAHLVCEKCRRGCLLSRAGTAHSTGGHGALCHGWQLRPLSCAGMAHTCYSCMLTRSGTGLVLSQPKYVYAHRNT